MEEMKALMLRSSTLKAEKGGKEEKGEKGDKGGKEAKGGKEDKGECMTGTVADEGTKAEYDSKDQERKEESKGESKDVIDEKAEELKQDKSGGEVTEGQKVTSSSERKSHENKNAAEEEGMLQVLHP